MKRDFAQVIANPIRQRIAQYLILNQKGTINEISKQLCDVPRASLYRHMKILLESGCIETVEEKSVRGAVEKTYALVQNPMGSPTDKEVLALIQNMLMTIIASFVRYFDREGADPQKDLLSVTTSTLMLSDKEFMEMSGQIGEIYSKYLDNKPDGDRKERCITFISSPANDY